MTSSSKNCNPPIPKRIIFNSIRNLILRTELLVLDSGLSKFYNFWYEHNSCYHHLTEIKNVSSKRQNWTFIGSYYLTIEKLHWAHIGISFMWKTVDWTVSGSKPVRDDLLIQRVQDRNIYQNELFEQVQYRNFSFILLLQRESLYKNFHDEAISYNKNLFNFKLFLYLELYLWTWTFLSYVILQI